jgi:hypothetical protein
MSTAFDRDVLLDAFDSIGRAAAAAALLGRYFPASAGSSEKQRFLLGNMNREGGADAPKYPR